jgi:hypothetical protein
MDMRKCKECGEEKVITDFPYDYRYGKYCGYTCKKCKLEYNKKYREENKLILLEKQKIYREENREEIKIRKQLHDSSNREKNRLRAKKWNEKNKDKKSEYSKSYYQNNKVTIRNRQNELNNTTEYKQKVYNNRNKPNNKIKDRLRHRIREAIKEQYGKKAYKTMELLGCSVDECRKWLESKFLHGMSWGNYGKWHIDHILPCASFDLTKPEEQLKCFHYTNLQPLWAKDNLSKGSKLPLDLSFPAITI